MKPNHEPNTLETSGESVASFGISSKDEAHVLGILRDQIYSDKILAVIREYSTNAWDANRSAGHGDIPIAVHLPTQDEPYFAVEDCGPGLSPSNVREVFTRYGASTKRDSDEFVGQLGIGSKSAFCYATSFAVVSRHDNEKRVYVCALDESDLGTVSLLSSESWGTDTGVEIRVAVRPGDIETFRSKALKLFHHFHPTPSCGAGPVPEPGNRIILEDLGWVDHGSGCTAVMGCVPYNVDLDQIELPEDLLWAQKAAVTLQFPIGAVQFAASREELRYTQKTKDALLVALGEITDKLVAQVLEDIESADTSAFARRLKLQQLNRFDLPLPAEYEDLARGWVQMVDKYDETVPFTMSCRGHAMGRVTINPGLHFFLQDQPNKLSGYKLDEHAYIISPRGKSAKAFAEASAAFESYVKATGLDGVPIAKLSTMIWVRPWNVKTRSAALPGSRVRYKANMLVLEADPAEWGGTFSRRWEAVSRAPDASDLYVELDRFQSSAYPIYKVAREVLKHLGQEMPTVYGYKLGKGTSPRVGVLFADWWHAKLKELLALPEIRAGLLAFEARECLPHLNPNAIAALSKLGSGHPLYQPYAALQTPAPVWAALLYPLSNFNLESAPAKKQFLLALKRYPLFFTANLNYQDDGVRAHWLEYIRLIDERDARKALDLPSPSDYGVTHAPGLQH